MFKTKKSGFTIIEVVLVLAIAGLIFLMVFVALPALQRSQRDTQRKNDATQLKTAIDNYKSNNRGGVPSQSDMAIGSLGGMLIDRSDSNFYQSYLIRGDENNFISPEGKPYFSSANYSGTISGGSWKPEPSDNPWAYNQFHFGTGTYCDGEAKRVGGGPNNYTIQILLESGGVICLDG
ncbi:MAG: type II secretion system protein [Candidatus Sacchiramonaceae bacterium]|nr:type II secretion system protein [Candidatus Saccharimonadaceae bacterium]